MENHFKKAIEFVKDNHQWSDEYARRALEIMDEKRLPISLVSDEITCEIEDLMEEYGFDNDLPEGWWYHYGDEDDVFWEMCKSD